jgi:hypothetical protein
MTASPLNFKLKPTPAAGCCAEYRFPYKNGLTPLPRLVDAPLGLC